MLQLDKVMDFSQEIDQRKVAVEYVFAIYAIELLKEIKYEEFDLELVLQYADANGLPWVNNHAYAKRFAESNRNDIIMYGRKKVGHFIKKLLAHYKTMPRHDFTRVPMDATLAQHIDRTIKNLNTDELRDRLKLESSMSENSGLRARPSYQLASEIDLLEKQVRHAAVHYKKEAHDNNFDWNYCDMFHSRLAKTLDDILRFDELSNTTFNTKFWAAALSLLFRLAQPKYLAFGRTIDLYKTVCGMHRDNFEKVIYEVRNYSCIAPISAIHLDLDTAVLPAIGNSTTVRVEPHSTVEKYLILHQLKHKY